jgi:hypothetical protein
MHGGEPVLFDLCIRHVHAIHLKFVSFFLACLLALPCLALLACLPCLALAWHGRMDHGGASRFPAELCDLGTKAFELIPHLHSTEKRKVNKNKNNWCTNVNK